MNLAPLHHLPTHLQEDKKNFCLPRNTFEAIKGQSNAFMVYSFLCANYDFLRKYSFATVRQIQRELGYGSNRTVTKALKTLRELNLIEVRDIEGIRGNCYQIYFIE